MEVIVKWIAVPLCLTVVWMVFLLVNDTKLLDKLSPRAKTALKIVLWLVAIALLVAIWLVRRKSGV